MAGLCIALKTAKEMGFWMLPDSARLGEDVGKTDGLTRPTTQAQTVLNAFSVLHLPQAPGYFLDYVNHRPCLIPSSFGDWAFPTGGIRVPLASSAPSHW